MTKAAIKRAAKREFKRHSESDIWLGLPFLESKMNECSVIHEKVISKERKAGKVLGRIKAIQAEYARTVSDNEEAIRQRKEKINHTRENIKIIEQAVRREEEKIRTFNENETSTSNEPISKTRQNLADYKSQQNALENEIEMMYNEMEMINSKNKQKLDDCFDELKTEYMNFSNRLNIVVNKINKKVAVKKGEVIIYTEMFWTEYVKRFNRRKGGGKLPPKPRLDIEKFKGNTKIFLDEKAKINEFNKKYGFEFNFS